MNFFVILDSCDAVVKKVAEQKLNDVMYALQTLLSKHPSLCTVHLLTALRDVLMKIKGNVPKHFDLCI